MKQVAIYCVNYHSYECLKNYLESVEKASLPVRCMMEISVFVADNSTPLSPVDYKPEHFTLSTLPTGNNMGYFGAVGFAMEQESPMPYDYVIISNVDILLDEDFFLKLNELSHEQSTGWIAPQIYSQVEKRDRNPKIIQRYPRRKLQLLRTLFRFPLLYNLYTHTAYKSKKLASHQPGNIYAGHGSFIILTREYFKKCGIINYPVFLFCEEIYLGEQCRQHNMKVVYEPQLRVVDAEHASTGKFRRSKYCKYNYDAISYILSRYY